jgi:hypothetical protein
MHANGQLPLETEATDHRHFQNDLPDDRYSVGVSSFQIKKFIVPFENRPMITMVFNILQTVARFLSDRRFARFQPLVKSTTQGVQLAASALEARIVFVACFQIATSAIRRGPRSASYCLLRPLGAFPGWRRSEPPIRDEFAFN